jgi:hypothetical protein
MPQPSNQPFSFSMLPEPETTDADMEMWLGRKFGTFFLLKDADKKYISDKKDETQLDL